MAMSRQGDIFFCIVVTLFVCYMINAMFFSTISVVLFSEGIMFSSTKSVSTEFQGKRIGAKYIGKRCTSAQDMVMYISS